MHLSEATVYEARSSSPQWKYVQFSTKIEDFQTLHNLSLRDPNFKNINPDTIDLGRDYGFYGLCKGFRK